MSLFRKRPKHAVQKSYSGTILSALESEIRYLKDVKGAREIKTTNSMAQEEILKARSRMSRRDKRLERLCQIKEDFKGSVVKVVEKYRLECKKSNSEEERDYDKILAEFFNIINDVQVEISMIANQSTSPPWARRVSDVIGHHCRSTQSIHKSHDTIFNKEIKELERRGFIKESTPSSKDSPSP